MGLDVALGIVVLLAALRGWFRGFLLQAIRLGGLVACVYLATPVRDLVRPLAREHLATVGHEPLDMLLWWAAAVVSYVVTTGLATWLVVAFRPRAYMGPDTGRVEPLDWWAKISRRHPYGGYDPYRGNQSAGAILGAAKGLVVVAFLAWGLDGYTPDYLKAGGWIGKQVRTSRVLAWSHLNQPAQKIYKSQPVQMFEAHIRRMGLPSPDEKPKPAQDQSDASSVQTASRPLAFPPPPDRLDPTAPDFNMEKALETVRDELGKAAKPR